MSCTQFQEESACDHSWSIEGWIHSKRRNKLHLKLVEKLVRAHTNLVLRESLDAALHHLLPWDIELIIDEPVDESEEEPEVQEEPIVPKKVVEEVIDEDAEFDAFFNKDKGKKYVVCKHPISGWQVKKEGSKRASRLFNTKKQAINFAIKSKFDYEIK